MFKQNSEAFSASLLEETNLYNYSLECSSTSLIKEHFTRLHIFMYSRSRPHTGKQQLSSKRTEGILGLPKMHQPRGSPEVSRSKMACIQNDHVNTYTSTCKLVLISLVIVYRFTELCTKAHKINCLRIYKKKPHFSGKSKDVQPEGAKQKSTS